MPKSLALFLTTLSKWAASTHAKTIQQARHIGFYDAESERYISSPPTTSRSPPRHCRDLQSPLADRDFLQMDQAESQDQGVPGHLEECRDGQIWVACYYLLLAYVKYQAHYKPSLFYLHRIVRETLLERASLSIYSASTTQAGTPQTSRPPVMPPTLTGQKWFRYIISHDKRHPPENTHRHRRLR